MTVREAQAVDVLLDWMFSTKQHPPAVLKDACVQLALGAERKGARWTPRKVLAERW